MKINSRPIRCYPKVKEKIENLVLDLGAIERKKLSTPEVLRRTFNISNLKDVLKKDAERKKGLRGFA